MVIGCVLSFIWMLLLPFLAGCLFLPFFRKQKEGTRTLCLATGLVLHYCTAQVLILGGVGFGWGMRHSMQGFAAVTVLFAAAGAFVLWKCRADLPKTGFSDMKKEPCFWAGILLMIVAVLAILLWSTPDLDDAFYSGLSAIAVARDEMLKTDAYHGLMARRISKRYVVSALPVYQGGLTYLTGGLHYLIIQHNLFPLFYMPLSFSLFYQVGKGFLTDKKQGARFLLVLGLLHLFGNYYVFSPENFVMTRMWQGKALFVAIGIPYLWLITQRVLDEGKLTGWFLVACGMLACTFMGETGLYLAPVMLGCMTMAFCLMKKKVWPLLWAILCCMPEVALLALIFIRG
ncbi:MAG: hypothetical protein K6E18_04025 [Lachnospiraceae bacterium]|nr:hypothetical protein [Lachnospiraceae bacterium]